MFGTSTAVAGSASVAARPVPRRGTPTLSAARAWHWLIGHRTLLILVTVLLVAGFAHGINMFHYPYYEDDEGTYMSQAWAVLHRGELAPYTYWYDHAPLGWIQIAGWTLLSGGMHAFGPTVESGRVFMLVLQLGSTALLFTAAYRISGRVTIATIASLLFALSPYGLYFHRRVLLDNICTTWMLASMVLLLSPQLSLKKVWLSALALGISILSKEVTIFLIPAMAYLVWYRTHPAQRLFAVTGWTSIVGSIVSFYVLMATLKGELFSQGTLLGGKAPHVSLLGTLKYQASRGKDGGLLEPGSKFYYWLGRWVHEEPTLVVGGTVCAFLCLAAFRSHRLIAITGLVTLSIYGFLARGGEVIEFYLVPLLPLLALNIALIFGLVADGARAAWGRRRPPHPFLLGTLGVVLTALGVSPILLAYAGSWQGLGNDHTIFWTSSQADAQNQAFAWVRDHVPTKSTIITDSYMWTDLHDGTGAPVFSRAHWHWKVDEDSAIRGPVFRNTWRTTDYVVTTIQLMQDARQADLKTVKGALAHSTALAEFDTGGWPIVVRRVDKPGAGGGPAFAGGGNLPLASRFTFAGGMSTNSERTAIHLMNPNVWPASVQITFYFPDGRTDVKAVDVDASSEKTVVTSDIEPTAGPFGLVLKSSRSIEAYLSRDHVDSGAQTLSMSEEPVTAWELMAGYVAPAANDSLSVFNPDSRSPAHVEVQVRTLLQPPTAMRMTVQAHALGRIRLPAQALGIRVVADRPVIVDRDLSIGRRVTPSAGGGPFTWNASQAGTPGHVQQYLNMQRDGCVATYLLPPSSVAGAWDRGALAAAQCNSPGELARFSRSIPSAAATSSQH